MTVPVPGLRAPSFFVRRNRTGRDDGVMCQDEDPAADGYVEYATEAGRWKEEGREKRTKGQAIVTCHRKEEDGQKGREGGWKEEGSVNAKVR